MKEKIKKILEKYPAAVFAAVALFLIYPSFSRGYIFALDWSIKPFVSLSDLRPDEPLGWLLSDLFSVLFSFLVFQRIFLFSLIFFSGLSGFRLLKGTGNLFARYFAGLFFIFNPFIYARLVEQPTIVAAGTAAFFWFGVFFLEFLKERSRRKIIAAALCSALAVSFSPHFVFFVGILYIFFLAANLFAQKAEHWKGWLVTTALFWGIVLALNANWMVPTFESGNTWAGKVANFTRTDIDAFETSAIGGHSVYTTVLFMQGYWGEYQDRFPSILDNPFWEIGYFAILLLAVFGTAKLWRKDSLAKVLAAVFLFAFVLAVGAASAIFAPLVLWLYRHVPFYIGLREPQKWVAVMVFVYAYLAGWGIKYLLDAPARFIRGSVKEIGFLCAALPVVFSFSMIGGMHVFSTPKNFPAEWTATKNQLDTKYYPGRILFLPWHSYMQFDFTGKTIVNPAEQYFGPRIIMGNNIEFGGLYSDFSDLKTKTIEKYVLGNDRTNFALDMEKLDVNIILLAKTEDWREYHWLDELPEIKKVEENGQFIIYEIK